MHGLEYCDRPPDPRSTESSFMRSFVHTASPSRVVLRRDTEMGPAFPEVVAGAAQLPDATALDGVM